MLSTYSKNATSFLDEKKYQLNVVDTCISGTVKALSINMKIHLDNQFKNKSKYQLSKPKTPNKVLILFHKRDRKDHVEDHYDTTVNCVTEKKSEYGSFPDKHVDFSSQGIKCETNLSFYTRYWY